MGHVVGVGRRLTSVFVLFLMYLGIIALTRAIDDPARSARAAAASSRWSVSSTSRSSSFRSSGGTRLHQPASVFRIDGPTIHPSLLLPLIVMAVGFTAVLDAPPYGDPHRDPSPPCRGDAADRGSPRRAQKLMSTYDLFVAAAYLLSAIGIAGLIGWILADQRARRRELAELEASGVRRRSERAGDAAQ